MTEKALNFISPLNGISKWNFFCPPIVRKLSFLSDWRRLFRNIKHLLSNFPGFRIKDLSTLLLKNRASIRSLSIDGLFMLFLGLLTTNHQSGKSDIPPPIRPLASTGKEVYFERDFFVPYPLFASSWQEYYLRQGDLYSPVQIAKIESKALRVLPFHLSLNLVLCRVPNY